VPATALREHDGACPAAAGVAADLGAGEVERLAEEIHEHLWLGRVVRHGVLLAIDGDAERLHLLLFAAIRANTYV
jgi:hypothetical protein